jgi:hypothetical protein
MICITMLCGLEVSVRHLTNTGMLTSQMRILYAQIDVKLEATATKARSATVLSPALNAK